MHAGKVLNTKELLKLLKTSIGSYTNTNRVIFTCNHLITYTCNVIQYMIKTTFTRKEFIAKAYSKTKSEKTEMATKTRCNKLDLFANTKHDCSTIDDLLLQVIMKSKD